MAIVSWSHVHVRVGKLPYACTCTCMACMCKVGSYSLPSVNNSLVVCVIIQVNLLGRAIRNTCTCSKY